METANPEIGGHVNQPNPQKHSNFWGYRIYDKKSLELYKLFKEEKCLRQGWGYMPEHDLRLHPKDKAVLRNSEILRKLKKGDYVAVVHFPKADKVCIVRATVDANDGYNFKQTNIPGEGTENDFGHMFPAEEVCVLDFSVLKDILKCRRRFWRLNMGRNRIVSILEGHNSHR